MQSLKSLVLEFSYEDIEVRVLRRMAAALGVDVRNPPGQQRGPVRPSRQARMSLQRAGRPSRCGPDTFNILHDSLLVDVMTDLVVTTGWSRLPGWPARCPGAGRLGRAWRGVRAGDRTVMHGAVSRMDLESLLRHSSLRGEVRAAIQSAVDMSKLADTERRVCTLADELGD